MGKSITPTYRLELEGNLRATPMAWNVKEAGRPTAENLERAVQVLNASYAPAGCNRHVADALEIEPVHTSARIVRQATGQVVAEWRAPSFATLEFLRGQ